MFIPKVFDLELMAKGFLAGEKRSNHRVAYFAGLLTGLRIASAFAGVKIKTPDTRLWTLMTGIIHPVPGVAEFGTLVEKYTCPDFRFNPDWVEEPELREGETSLAYAQGLADATEVGMFQAPHYFRSISEDRWHLETRGWLGIKIRWAYAHLISARGEYA